MLLGSDGLGGLYFDDINLAQQLSSLALVFIMFYGGFGFKWKKAKPIVPQAALLATLGVIITAICVGLFTWLVLKVSFWEGMLLGAVVSSTDAASVFSILRSKKLNLKHGLASLLEMESGSNDPMSYILTIVVLSLISSAQSQSVLQIILLLFNQMFFGLLIGLIIALFGVFLLRHINLEIDGLYPILVTAIVLLGYSITELASGNGFLATYIIGIVMGNKNIIHKRSLVYFFDGLSWLMQIVLFFTLGLLVFPSQLPKVFFPALAISVFLVLVARPIAVASILSWFKTPFKEQLLVSWVGLRGAASIAFATYTLSHNIPFANDIFNIVFFITLISVSLQGSFLPKIAKKLDLVEEDNNTYKAFSDYHDESKIKMIELTVNADNPWAGKKIMDANIPEEILVILIKRNDEVLTPRGSTTIEVGDTLVLGGNNFEALFPSH